MRGDRILVVEDDAGWIELLKLWFPAAGYSRVEYAMTGAQALEAAVSRRPDCVLLDFALPDQNGSVVCGKLRAIPDLARVPVVMFTAHGREKVLGLENGADYFVGKSDSSRELMATLDALFKRAKQESGVLNHGQLTLRASDRQILWKDEPVAALTPKAFALFHILVERGPGPVSRDDLYRMVEGVENPGLSRALDVMLNRLKKALPKELADRIVNVKNFGYCFLEDRRVTKP
ncbi:MAG: response regulator transcription factor [Elusimicrobiota bacterium]|nr:response regulator transcription factor [Elusimicrobiota bacterium]